MFKVFPQFPYKMRISTILAVWEWTLQEPDNMDIVVVMFGSLISTMTALSFLEIRRIRKIAESKTSATSTTSTDAQAQVPRKAG